MKRKIDYLATAAIIYAGLVALPAVIWIDVRSVTIADAARGDDPDVSADRAIWIGFDGSYTADVRNLETGNVICGRPSGHRYKSGLDGRLTMKLSNYAGGDLRCAHLPVGQYQAEFCWTIHDALWGILPAKRTCTLSNIFRIGDAV